MCGPTRTSDGLEPKKASPSGVFDMLFYRANSVHALLRQDMKRREFLASLGGAALFPLGAHAQPGSVGMPIIGYFSLGRSSLFTDRIAAFRDGLRREGFIEGRNVAIEFRWAET